MDSANDRHGERLASWSSRARAYDRLSRSEPVFGHLADRLISGLPPSVKGARWMDLGAGAGLLAERVLRMGAVGHVHLVEPVEAMRRLASTHLAPYRGEFTLHDAHAATVGELGLELDAVLSSATLHQTPLDTALGSIARCLSPGGFLHFNLWGHSFDETLPEELSPDPWRPALARVLAEKGRMDAMPEERPLPRREVQSRSSLDRLAEHHGFDSPKIWIERDTLTRGFELEFAAMAPEFLAPLDPGERRAVLDATRRSLADPVDYPSVRVLLRRR